LASITVEGHAEHDAESHNTKALRCGEVAVRDTHVLELRRPRIVHLHVRRNVAVAVSLAKFVEVLISDFTQIKLVIARGEDIVVYLFEQLVAFRAVELGCIAQASAIMKVASIYKQ